MSLTKSGGENMTLNDILDYLTEQEEKAQNESVDLYEFYHELQNLILKLDNDVKGQMIVGYGGVTNNVPNFLIVDRLTKTKNADTTYISNTTSGRLISGFTEDNLTLDSIDNYHLVLDKLTNITHSRDLALKIMSGYEAVVNENGKLEKKRTGPSSGIGDLLPLDDFISKFLMSSFDVNSNVIVFQSGDIDPQKVFASTELETIFENPKFLTINGMSKALLKDIYYSSEEGKKFVYDIIVRSAKIAVPGKNVDPTYLKEDIGKYFATKEITPELNAEIELLSDELNRCIINGGILSPGNNEIRLTYSESVYTFHASNGMGLKFSLPDNGNTINSEYSIKIDMSNADLMDVYPDDKSIVELIKSDNDLYNKFLKFQGTIYKHNVYVALEFFTQNPDVEFVGTAEQWNGLGYTIGLGEVGLTYTDKYGEKQVYFDYSQTVGGQKPVVWSVNSKNVAYLKKELGIPENQRVIPGLLNKTITAEDIQNCATLLKVNSKNVNEFKRAYLNAVQMIVAGRLEVNGADFNIKADNLFVKNLSYEQTMILLTYALLSARKALNAAEKVILNYNEQERIKRNESNIQTVDDLNRNPEAEHSERGLTGDSTRKPDEQSDLVESDKDSSRQSDSDNVGDNSLTGQGNENSTDTGVQKPTDTGRNNTELLSESFDGNIRSDVKSGTDSERGTDRSIRSEVDGLHGTESSASDVSNDAGTQVFDGSTQGRSGSTGLQGETGTGIRSEKPETTGLRSESVVGERENDDVGRNSDERNSSDAETLNSSFSDIIKTEASAKSADASNYIDELFYDEDDHADDDLPEIIYAENPRGRLSDNINAIETVKRLDARERLGYGTGISENEKRVLRGYVGWGGLADVFDETKSNYSRERQQLKELLTEQEYKDARGSTLNAHYTSQIVIDAMYKAVNNMELPRNARILEPSCGTGNFITRLPVKFLDAEVVGVELDGITTSIAHWLNKDNDNITIINSPFEKSDLADNSFDLAIGNVPFGNYNLIDPAHKDTWKIHDAFFRKALDKIAPGGVVAFISSTGTMDKKNPKVREYLAQQSDLIGAIRLPNNAFSDAGTKTATDIIFLQKRENPRLKGENPDWCYTTENDDGLRINSYFVQNPKMILGKMEETSHYNMLTCSPIPNENLKDQLDKAITYLNATINVKKREDALEKMRGTIEPWGSNFSYQVNENGAFFRENNTMRELNLSEKEKDRLKALIDIRSATRELVDLQRTEISDEALMPKREQLNVLYDNFVKKYGPINQGKVNSKIFNMDYDFPLVTALENYNKETNTYSKADIFSKRTVAPVVSVVKANNIEEAFQISMDQRGKIDIPYMAKLLNEVYTSENAASQIAKELIQNGYAFRDPDEIVAGIPFSDIREKSEYLSGNVRHKLLSAAEAAENNPEYARNVEALKEVIPEDIPAEEIGVRMGCAWIDAEDYGKFLTHLSGKDYTQCEVSYDALSGEYSVSNSNKRSGFNINESSVYGTEDVNMYKLAERILNQRRIVVQYKAADPVTGKDKTYTDAKATALALEKAKIMKNEFTKWLFSDEKRREKYERRYNDTFNCLVGRTYDGSKLTFPGMNSEFHLRPHQKDCVARTIYGGNTLAAHVVGAGKSAVIISSVMKKKDIGLINKACVVVPKPLTEQTANEWRKIYPSARLLVVDNKDLSDENKRKLFTAKVATGSYDAVIMSNEQFEKLSMSNEYKATYIQKKIDDYEDLLRTTKANQSSITKKSDAKTIKQIEEALVKLRIKLEAILNPVSDVKAKDKFIEFEALGFDYLVVDEAHNYKNGSIVSKMENVTGVAGKASMRAEDMRMKTDYFNTKFGQGHILFATGTPVSNTMTELYVMKQYLRPDLLKAQGVERFDDWAATFGNVVTKNQQTADGRLKLKSKFASFVNLPELMSMYKEFADIQSAEKLNLPRPALKGGKIQVVKAPATPEQKEYVKQLAERAQLIEAGAVSPHEDNHLTITGEARLVGLGNLAIKALYAKKGEVPADFVVEKNSKVDMCIENVARLYKETEATKGVQIIFSDIAINSDNGNFSVYEYIKDELINEHGIPADEIIFAPKSDSKNREQIFSDINNSKYRIVIASTSTLGTGANIQKNLYALHHVDIPWKPSDFTQREGRILRQGNQNKEVEIFNYVTEGTLDSYLYQTVTDKARFIAQLMDNKAPARVSEDCDEKVLTYAEIQAAAEGNPDFKRRIELGNEIAELTMLRNEYYRETAAVRSKLKDYPESIARLKTNIQKCSNDIVSAAKIKDALTVKTHDGKVLTEAKEINYYLLSQIRKSVFANGKTSETFTIGDFKVNAFSAVYTPSNTDTAFKVQGETLYTCKANSEDNSNNLLRLSNLFDSGIQKRMDELNNTLSKEEADMLQSEQRVNIPFADEEKLEKLTEEFNEIEERLSGLSESSDDVISADEDAVTNNSPTDNINVEDNKIDDDDDAPTI